MSVVLAGRKKQTRASRCGLEPWKLSEALSPAVASRSRALSASFAATGGSGALLLTMWPTGDAKKAMPVMPIQDRLEVRQPRCSANFPCAYVHIHIYHRANLRWADLVVAITVPRSRYFCGVPSSYQSLSVLVLYALHILLLFRALGHEANLKLKHLHSFNCSRVAKDAGTRRQRQNSCYTAVT